MKPCIRVGGAVDHWFVISPDIADYWVYRSTWISNIVLVINGLLKTCLDMREIQIHRYQSQLWIASCNTSPWVSCSKNEWYQLQLFQIRYHVSDLHQNNGLEQLVCLCLQGNIMVISWNKRHKACISNLVCGYLGLSYNPEDWHGNGSQNLWTFKGIQPCGGGNKDDQFGVAHIN